MVLLILQLNISSQGLRSLSDPSWYRNSYEEKVAEKLQTWIPDQVRDDGILIASMPEPYYFRLRLTTHSISDAPPYIYIPDSLNDRTVLIIQDMGMRDVFPHFNNILDTKLQKYKKSEFKVNGTYHTANVSIPENDPVVVYEIKLGELRKLLN